ncbi:competence damage-inducible protein A [Camelimonas fluminis]|uniref:CinA family protein n=1 Tax=Camelimonas fluminis TaxID=1576911 RepID=A0ABV7UJJ7_9HYPH|nr:CinA family protein [Camelimonas fluminis]GHE58697.1 competence damage-inducible protein A [Camelimonas fluminis]
MIISPDIERQAEDLLAFYRRYRLTLATVESCTGGMVAAALTGIPGASDVIDRGYVTYSNRAKHEMVGVPKELLERFGAVSEQAARAMAIGALSRCPANVTVAITGIAGPGGGSEEKPVGLVHFAAAREGRETLHVERRFGEIGRAAIRSESVLQALELLRQMAEE